MATLPKQQREIVKQRYTSKGTLKALAEKLNITTHKIGDTDTNPELKALTN